MPDGPGAHVSPVDPSKATTAPPAGLPGVVPPGDATFGPGEVPTRTGVPGYGPFRRFTGYLDVRTKEMIAAYVSALNDCRF